MKISKAGLVNIAMANKLNPEKVLPRRHDPLKILVRCGFTNRSLLPKGIKVFNWNDPRRKAKRESLEVEKTGIRTEGNDVSMRQFVRDLFNRRYGIADVHAYRLKEEHKTRYFLVVTFSRNSKPMKLSRDYFFKIAQLLWLDGWGNMKYDRNPNGLHSVSLSCRKPNQHNSDGIGELCYAADEAEEGFECEVI